MQLGPRGKEPVAGHPSPSASHSLKRPRKGRIQKWIFNSITVLVKMEHMWGGLRVPHPSLYCFRNIACTASGHIEYTPSARRLFTMMGYQGIVDFFPLFLMGLYRALKPNDGHNHRQGATSRTSRVTSLQGQSRARTAWAIVQSLTFFVLLFFMRNLEIASTTFQHEDVAGLSGRCLGDC